MLAPSRTGSRGRAGRLVAALIALLLVFPLVQGCAERTEESVPSLEASGVPPPEARPADWPVLPREGGVDRYDDPLEGMNRVFFYVNGALDYVILSPLAKFYRALVPEDGRQAVGRAFTNLAEPIVAVNHLLQLEYERSGTSLGRFLVNSTLGVVGLFDIATDFGLPADDSDFGQTLHHYGVGDGPYIVLPFFGSYSTRDAAGFATDGLFDPRTYLLDPVPRLALGFGEGVVRREEVIDPIDFLAEYAIDHYVAVRAWTYQKRQRQLTGECTEPIHLICPGYAPEPAE